MSQGPLAGPSRGSPHDPPPDPITAGARARAQGRPKDACPYPAPSAARVAWLEGYDGAPVDRAPDLPVSNG